MRVDRSLSLFQFDPQSQTGLAGWVNCSKSLSKFCHINHYDLEDKLDWLDEVGHLFLNRVSGTGKGAPWKEHKAINLIIWSLLVKQLSVRWNILEKLFLFVTLVQYQATDHQQTSVADEDINNNAAGGHQRRLLSFGQFWAKNLLVSFGQKSLLVSFGQ